MRNPWINPKEGDVLKYITINGYRELIIDVVKKRGSETEIAFRIVDGIGGLCRATRTTLENWKASAISGEWVLSKLDFDKIGPPDFICTR